MNPTHLQYRGAAGRYAYRARVLAGHAGRGPTRRPSELPAVVRCDRTRSRTGFNSACVVGRVAPYGSAAALASPEASLVPSDTLAACTYLLTTVCPPMMPAEL